MNFEDGVKEWVQLDNQLRVYNEKIKQVKERKAELFDKIAGNEDVFDTQLHNKTIQISDGRLKFTKTRVASPLTFKYLQSTMGKIIRNEQQVEQIIQYLKDNREIKLVPEIKRYS